MAVFLAFLWFLLGDADLVPSPEIKLPAYQVVKEKKATVVQSTKNFEIVKKIQNLPSNLRISGDWTQSDLPCTIEGSILSGLKAANT